MKYGIKNFLENNHENYKNWLIDNNYGGVEIKILKYLQEIDNGVFVEAGAHDGVFQSTTKILEDLGWSGILIEPSESLYNKCLQNRKSISENYALVSFDYDKETIQGELSDILIQQNNGITLMGDKNEICKTITLTELCKTHSINYIDFLSLDVEGYELEVMKGIDFKKITINFMLVEWNQKMYTINQLIEFMNNNGFDLICNLSNFTSDNCPTWPGTHQDFLFKNKNI
jgi:FkbM family methyltransferase